MYFDLNFYLILNEDTMIAHLQGNNETNICYMINLAQFCFLIIAKNKYVYT